MRRAIEPAVGAGSFGSGFLGFGARRCGGRC